MQRFKNPIYYLMIPIIAVFVFLLLFQRSAYAFLPGEPYPLPRIPVPVTLALDITGDVGRASVMRLKPNGYPIIAYYDTTYHALKLYNCTSYNCSTGSARTLEGSLYVTDFSIAMEIRSNGYPLITYHESTQHRLFVYDCANTDCSTGTKRVVISNTGLYGNFTSLAIRPSGLPIIAYYEGNTGDLRVFRCATSNCSSGTSITLDSKAVVGRSTGLNPTIEIMTNGNPIILYREGNETEGLTKIKKYVCNDVDCNSGTLTVIEMAYNPLKLAPHTDKSIIIRKDGRPLLSYWAEISNGQKYRMNLFDCDNVTCSTGHIIYDVMGRIGSDHKLFTWNNGMPAVLASIDTSTGERRLRIMYCLDLDCTSSNMLAFDNGPWTDERLDIVFRKDNGQPLISLHKGDTQDLAVFTSNVRILRPIPIPRPVLLKTVK